MIISKKKHERIVSMKDADIVVLENSIFNLKQQLTQKELNIGTVNGKLEGTKELLKKSEQEKYEVEKEANQLSNELSLKEKRIEDLEIAINYSDDERKELKRENEELADKIINMREDYNELQKECNAYKRRLNTIDSLKVQYKEYIDKAIEATAITHQLTRRDTDKFLSSEGINGIVKLYTIASMM